MHRNGQTAKPHQAGSFSFLPLKQTCRPDGRSSHGSTTHPEPITARARACGSGRRHAASKLLRARHDPNPNPNGAGGPGAHSRVTHQHSAHAALPRRLLRDYMRARDQRPFHSSAPDRAHCTCGVCHAPRHSPATLISPLSPVDGGRSWQQRYSQWTYPSPMLPSLRSSSVD